MMGIKERAFGPLPPVSLEDLVPPDHFYRHLERTLHLAFVRDVVREAYAGTGRPSVDPVVFFKVSTTDADATPTPLGDGRTHLGYQDHYVVDGGRARIILAALVTPAEVQENQPALDLLWWARFRWKLQPRQVTGDTTYGTTENIVALEDAGIRAFFPLPDFDHRTAFFGRDAFAYDAEGDVYRCPQGQSLPRRKTKYTEQEVLYRAEATTCNTGLVKAACTASDHGRIVHRSFYEEYLAERPAHLHETTNIR